MWKKVDPPLWELPQGGGRVEMSEKDKDVSKRVIVMATDNWREVIAGRSKNSWPFPVVPSVLPALFALCAPILLWAPFVLRHPCPFHSFRPDPPPVGALTGGVNFFFTFNHVTSNIIIKMKPEQLEKVSSSKKNLCLILKIFFEDLLFFHGTIVAIFEVNLGFWAFDRYNFSRLKSGE